MFLNFCHKAYVSFLRLKLIVVFRHVYSKKTFIVYRRMKCYRFVLILVLMYVSQRDEEYTVHPKRLFCFLTFISKCI